MLCPGAFCKGQCHLRMACHFFTNSDHFYLLKQASLVSEAKAWEHLLVKIVFVLLGHH